MKYINQTPEQIRQTFQDIDLNRDGEITQIEFIKALRKSADIADRLGLPHSIQQEAESRKLFQQAFHEMDIDDSKTISMDEFCAFYLPMPAVDSAPPPQVQQASPYQGYEGYTAVGSHTHGKGASGPSHHVDYLPQAMPSLMQIEGPTQDAPVQIKRNTAPRASRNAPPAAFPGSMPPAGNQQPPRSPGQGVYQIQGAPQAYSMPQQPIQPSVHSPRTTTYVPWLPNQPSPPSNPTYKTLSPSANTNLYQTFGAMQLAPQLISSPTMNQPGYNALPVYQLPPVQQNVQIIERIVEKPVEKIVYVDRYIQSPPPPASHYPSPPPSYMSPAYDEAPVLLQQDSQLFNSTSTWKEVDIIPSRRLSPVKPPTLLQRQPYSFSTEFDPGDFAMPEAELEQPALQKAKPARAVRSAAPPRATPPQQHLALPAPEQLALPAPPPQRQSPQQQRLALPAPPQRQSPQQEMLALPAPPQRPSPQQEMLALPAPPQPEPVFEFQKQESRRAQRSAPAPAPAPPPPQTFYEHLPAPISVPMSQRAVGHIVGIGLQLENTNSGQGADVEVVNIVPGFAAFDSNQFDIGDIVLTIDNVPVRGVDLANIKKLTIGEAGTNVVLTMRSLIEGRDYRVTLTRKVPDHVDRENEACTRAVFVE